MRSKQPSVLPDPNSRWSKPDVSRETLRVTMVLKAPYGISGVQYLSVSASEKERVARSIKKHTKLLKSYETALLSFNRKHNLVSRSAENHFFPHHIQHSLAIACRDFPPDVHIVDWGSGGGLPAIPLAVIFPSVHITALDKVGKKMQVVEAIVRRLSIGNVSVCHSRAEDYHENAEFSVSRATAPLRTLWKWHSQVARIQKGSVAKGCDSGQGGTSFWPPGLICLKGGDLAEEIKILQDWYPDLLVSVLSVDELFNNQPYFREKVIVHVQLNENT